MALKRSPSSLISKASRNGESESAAFGMPGEIASDESVLELFGGDIQLVIADVAECDDRFVFLTACAEI